MGYEGPGTAFSGVSADRQSGLITFGPPIASGASAYFSLEQRPVSAALPPGALAGGSTAVNPNAACGVVNTPNPVTTSTGNFWHSFSDLTLPGRGPAFNLERTYNSSLANVDGPFGFGWSSTYTMSLSVAPTGVATITQENGSQVAFTPSGGGYTAPPWVIATLTRDPSNGSYVFTRRGRERISFGSSGALATIVDPNGYGAARLYGSAAFFLVNDPVHRNVIFYTNNSRITRVEDPTGRAVTYGYDGAGNLTDVVDVTGGHWTFSYDASHRMVTMREPRFFGDATTSPTPELRNTYDTSSRVVAQTDALGRTTTFDYASVAGGTKVTDPKGNVTLDVYGGSLLTSRTRGYGTAQAATWSYLHDPATLGCTRVTDPDGHTWSASYDGSGNRTRTSDDCIRPPPSPTTRSMRSRRAPTPWVSRPP